jgi:hypothetical protein
MQEMKLHSRVPELMKLRGVHNANQLKVLTGLGYATCYRLSLGGLPSRSSTIACLAEALGVTPGELFRNT